MPFVYGVEVGANFATSATPLTEVDALFLKPGAGATLSLIYAWMQGKMASATTLNALVQRIKVWTSTASSGGSAITPSPHDQRAPASSATAGQATAGITPGTGGPALKEGFGCTATGPGQWDSLGDLNRAITLAAAATQSIDFFNSSATASINFETGCDIQE